MTCASTGPPTKLPAAAKEPAKAPLTGANQAGSRSIAIDGAGIPVAWAAAGANRNDIMLFDPTIAEIERQGLHHDTETLHLDRGYWGARVDRSAAAAGITDLVRPPKRKPGHDGPAEPAPAPLGLRWRVERTNSWLSNYGQLRRNTDRKPEHRLAQLALAVTLIIAIKLIDHRNRWQPHNRPIR